MTEIDPDVATSGHAGPADDGTQLGRLLSMGVTGVAVGATEAVIAVSFGGLVFGRPLPDLLPAGVGLGLFGAAVVLVVTGLLATVPGTVGSIQDAPVAVLAVIVAGVAVDVSAAAAPSTVLATIALAVAVTGAGLFALGAFRLGGLVRFVPFPVIGGFLAGSGWIILDGAVGFLAGSGGLLDPGALLAADVWPRTLTGAALGLVLFAGIRRWGPTVALPAIVLGATAVFYLVVGLSPGGVDAADAWLLSGVPAGRLWPPADPGELAAIDWGAVLGAAPGILTLLAVSALSLLLNASGIELLARRDVDLDRELRAAGTANVVAAVGGGLPGFQAVSLTAMAHRTGSFHRGVPLVGAAFVVAVLVVGGGVVARLPRPVLGGVLVFLGVAFLHEWLVERRTRMTHAEYGVVLLITAVIALWGVIQGVLVGLVATVVLFSLSYSRTAVVKHRTNAADHRSPVDRAPEEEATLRASGDAIVILELQGFLFFGTARRILDRVRQELASSQVRYLVLDLRRVTGLDSSSALAFAKIAQLADRHGTELLLSGCSAETGRILRRSDGIDDGVRMLPDLDTATQWCEDHLLAVAAAEPAAEDAAERLVRALGGDALARRLLARLERVAVRSGHRLMSEGDAPDDLYLLTEGTLTASIMGRDGTPLRLRTMRPGAVVGEVSAYTRGARTATVVAETDACLLRLPHTTLEALATEDPELAAAVHRWLASLLAGRLSTSLATIAALRD